MPIASARKDTPPRATSCGRAIEELERAGFLLLVISSVHKRSGLLYSKVRNCHARMTRQLLSLWDRRLFLILHLTSKLLTRL
jgi:hypothetical protein